MNKTSEAARAAIRQEAAALERMAAGLGAEFERAVDILFACAGRVVLTGVGKAGLVARKIAATLASTGTPAFFIHPADAVHGDLGMVTPDSVMIALSHSGQSDEVLRLIPYLKHFKIPLIVITGNGQSELARQADVVLITFVTEEACPLNLAPTTSTTAMMALGDALAIALLTRRDFKPEHFAIFHPSGVLGRRLLLKAADLMHSGRANPVIGEDRTLKEGILEMTSKGLGITSITDSQGRLTGVLTDGDMRRILEQGEVDLNRSLRDVLAGLRKRISSPRTTSPDSLAVKALDIMEEFKITALPVVDEQERPIGMLHLHDLIRAGITT
ncbi:MAG: KpsF/GutQ family sugar-phosphate isomerase [Candidatus Sumerlaeia bacterium]